MPARAHPDPSLSSAGTWGSPRRLQILVIDDDALVRETLTQIIGALDAGDVTQAATGIEAIRLVTDDPDRFDLLFCDLQMPGSDGLDVLEACATAGMKSAVVLMSGSGESNLRAAVAEAARWKSALARTIVKPFSVADVKAVLRGFARGR